MATQPAGQLKRSSASLTGGIFVGVAATVIAGLVLTEIDVAANSIEWLLAVLVGLIFAGYVRLADL